MFAPLLSFFASASLLDLLQRSFLSRDPGLFNFPISEWTGAPSGIGLAFTYTRSRITNPSRLAHLSSPFFSTIRNIRFLVSNERGSFRSFLRTEYSLSLTCNAGRSAPPTSISGQRTNPNLDRISRLAVPRTLSLVCLCIRRQGNQNQKEACRIDKQGQSNISTVQELHRHRRAIISHTRPDSLVRPHISINLFLPIQEEQGQRSATISSLELGLSHLFRRGGGEYDPAIRDQVFCEELPCRLDFSSLRRFRSHSLTKKELGAGSLFSNLW